MVRRLNDFELLYLINNNANSSVEVMLDKYNPLVWKHVFKYTNYNTPKGVEMDDLYQEGRIALYDSFYHFKTGINVPFYAFTKLCIERKMGGYLRKFNSETSRLFYNCLSLDMTVTEDHNVYLHEMICEDKDDVSAFIRYEEELKIICNNESILNDFEKNVLLLKIGGYSYDEMGVLLKCSSKKVDNTLQKVKRLLVS